MKLNDTEFIFSEQKVSIDVLLEKYAKGDERSIDDVRRRVARALAAVEQDAAPLSGQGKGRRDGWNGESGWQGSTLAGGAGGAEIVLSNDNERLPYD